MTATSHFVLDCLFMFAATWPRRSENKQTVVTLEQFIEAFRDIGTACLKIGKEQTSGPAQPETLNVKDNGIGASLFCDIVASL